jgi:hypothetical protein
MEYLSIMLEVILLNSQGSAKSVKMFTFASWK